MQVPPFHSESSVAAHPIQKRSVFLPVITSKNPFFDGSILLVLFSDICYEGHNANTLVALMQEYLALSGDDNSYNML